MRAETLFATFSLRTLCRDMLQGAGATSATVAVDGSHKGSQLHTGRKPPPAISWPFVVGKWQTIRGCWFQKSYADEFMAEGTSPSAHLTQWCFQ